MKKNQIAILFFLIMAILFCYKIYDSIFNLKNIESIEIMLLNHKNEKTRPDFFFLTPKGKIVKAPFSPNNVATIKKRFVKSILVDLKEEKNSIIQIKIGNKKFLITSNVIITKWNKIKDKHFPSIIFYKSNNSISLNRSKVPFLSSLINWSGDLKLFSNAILFSFLITLSIFLISIIFLFSEKKITSFLNKKNSDFIIIPFLIIFTLIIKFLFFEMIEVSGDAIWTWFNVKKLTYGLPYDCWDHHTTRLTKIFLTYLFQLIFGTKAIVYYLAPLFTTVMAAIMIYKIGSLILNKTSALLLFFFFVFFTPLNRGCFQLIPSIFSIASMLFCIYFLIKYLFSEKKLYLIISSIVFFIAYLSDVINLFFLPGIFLILILYKRKNTKKLMTEYAIFGLIPLFLFLVETFIYYKLTGNIFGRLGIIKTTHLEETEFTLSSFFHLFRRFTTMNEIWTIVFYTFLVVGLFILVSKSDILIKSIVLMIFIFFFLVTFTIVKINPIKPVLKFNDRYLDASLPFIFISFSYFLTHFTKKLEKFFMMSFNKKNLISYLSIFTIVILYFLINFKIENITIKESPLILTPLYEKKINDAFKNKTPIVIIKNSEYPETKFLALVNYVFLNKEFITENNKIKLNELFYYSIDNKTVPLILNENNEKIKDLMNQYYTQNYPVLILQSSNKNSKTPILKEITIHTLLKYYDYYSNF